MVCVKNGPNPVAGFGQKAYAMKYSEHFILDYLVSLQRQVVRRYNSN